MRACPGCGGSDLWDDNLSEGCNKCDYVNYVDPSGDIFAQGITLKDVQTGRSSGTNINNSNTPKHGFLDEPMSEENVMKHVIRYMYLSRYPLHEEKYTERELRAKIGKYVNNIRKELDL